MPSRLTLQGTTYQKTDAAVEMKRINREQFWEQAKVGSAVPKPSGPGVPTRACRVALTSLGSKSKTLLVSCTQGSSP